MRWQLVARQTTVPLEVDHTITASKGPLVRPSAASARRTPSVITTTVLSILFVRSHSLHALRLHLRMIGKVLAPAKVYDCASPMVAHNYLHAVCNHRRLRKSISG